MGDDLEKRVANLELALHSLWALVYDLQPPQTQRDVHDMFNEHFEASRTLGGFSKSEFQGHG